MQPAVSITRSEQAAAAVPALLSDIPYSVADEGRIEGEEEARIREATEPDLTDAAPKATAA